MQFGKYFACLLPVLSLVSGAFAQNNTLPTVPENSPYVTYIHGLGADGFYNASAETLTLSGAPSYFYLPGKTAFCNPTATPGCPTATLSVTVQIDNSGNLIGGNPVAGQPDLELTGQVTSGGVTYTSPLLTGTVTQFFYDGVNNTQNFDLRFAVTGGSMAALYLNPPSMDSDLWMTLNLEAVAGATDFQGTFGSSFGGEIKGDIYSTPGKCFGTIGDFVWNDLNANGIQDAGEPGINGVTVNLFDYQGNLLQSVATQQGPTGSQLGYYQFTGVCAGTYTVKVDETTLPKGTNGKIIFAETTPNAPGSTTANDSNPNPSTVTLATNDSSDETIDFGYVALQGAIGDYVWYDANGNGLQDAGEPGINGVTVDLYDSTQTNLLATTTTAYGGPNNVNGYYQFTGLSAGSYVVAVDSTTLPPSYTPTTSFVGSNSAIDSNGSPAAVTLATDSSVDETIDFGYVSPCNGTIGDFVWHDLNQNGIQDTGEPGIGGITLDLYNSAYTLIQTAITNGGGNYLFSGLCAGDYTVTVVGSTLPPNFTPTISQAPGSTTANDSNGSPAPVVLTTDSSNNVVSDLTIDFGYVSPCNGAIGDFVWWDQNGNGIQDAGEPGIANVTVSLYNSQMTLLNATTTNSVGYYQFTGLCAGTYIVQVTPPAGYSLTTANAPGSTLANDSNPNPSTVVLSITDSNGDITHDETIDFGFVLPTLSMTCASVTAGEVGVSFNSGAMTVTGGLAPYTFSVVGTLPAGLSLNASTGAVTGTPTASGSFTVQVTDAVGDVSTTCAITIVAGPSLSCSSVTSGEVGVAFNSGAMTVTGGTAPYTFSVSGTLPAGLSLNASTGAVTGTPTAAGSFSINVTDKNGITATGTCAITIVAGPSLSCSSVTSGEVGVAFNSGAMTVTGGTAPYTFSVSGTLPAGLSLNALTGAVTGTPTASGSFSIKVTDKNGITATGTCAITIVAGPSLSCSSVTSGEVGVAFNSGAMTVTGGSAPYTFSVSGTLPAGLSLNASTGAVTGTPTASGSFSIKVTDAKGAIITSNCTITIAGTAGPSCVFGVASAYNLVALTGNISDSADITGRIAADGQVTQATTIGTKLRTSDLYISEASKNGGPWAIVAAGGIPTSNSFNVNAGGNVYSSTATSASFNFANENYSGSPYENSKLVTGGSSPINFSTLQTEMYSLTKQLAGLTANGAVCSVNSSGKIVAGGGCPTSSTSYNPSWIVLYGTSATTNIFNLTQAQFQGSNNLDFVVPAGSTVIVNIAGTSDTLQSSIYFNGATVTDANASSILFNFATATTVTINAQFDATLLAPYAHLSGGSQMGGTFIAASVGSTGEVHYDAFTSTLPITGACSQ